MHSDKEKTYNNKKVKKKKKKIKTKTRKQQFMELEVSKLLLQRPIPYKLMTPKGYDGLLQD